MALNTPNDRTLVNVIGTYEREIAGRPLSTRQLAIIAEAAKRFVLDEIHSLKSST